MTDRVQSDDDEEGNYILKFLILKNCNQHEMRWSYDRKFIKR